MLSEVIVGAIYWPITQPWTITRSEKIPYPFPASALFENSTELYCPHLRKDNACRLKDNNKKCVYKCSSGEVCDYDDYHNLFLLLEKDSNNGNRNSLKAFEESAAQDPKTYREMYFSEKYSKHFPKTLNAFPQTKDSKLSALKDIDSGMPDGLFFHIRDKYIDLGNVDVIRLDKYKEKFAINDIVYLKSEYIELGIEENMNASSDTFSMLIEKDKIKKLLPLNSMEKTDGETDVYFPVELSFFADSKVDAGLSLAIRTKNEDIEKNATLVRQALGSLREVIYSKRQELLEKWCMRLGERVDDIVQKSNPENPANHNQAIKEAMKFALKAIFTMAQSLAGQHSGCDIKKISKLFDYETDKKKKNPEQIFKCIDDNFIVELDEDCVDRKKYVIDFCKKAEMYAEEFVSSEGKLKGRLSASTVRELKKISLTSNPVNARILIKGEPGGGKGVTAEDFHLYCMKRIAEEIKEIELKRNEKTVEIDAMRNGSKKEDEKKKLEKDPYTYLIKHSKHLKEVEKKLQEIFLLPAIYSEISVGSEANFFLRQISNTGWWLWNRTPVEEENIEEQLNLTSSMIDLCSVQGKIKTNIRTLEEKNRPASELVAAEKYFTDDDGTKEKLISFYVKLLSDKIKFEGSSKKPNWSFNMLQVNCGILGGENSELSESIARLFGISGDYNTAMPGLFQTCSYMGGTLFLDEIADCPVRVQDNLLRPLEEGKVSRPGWETFDEEVDNIRIVGATFKDLFKLALQYQETFPSGNPKGFRPDLLTRLTHNPPVSVTPVWKYFVPTKPIDIKDFHSQFAFVLNNAWEVSTDFWLEVYYIVSKQIDEYRKKSRYHVSGEYEGRRKFASKITMRLFREVGKIARLKKSTKNPEKIKKQHKSALKYLSRMLDYLLVETN